MDLTCRTEDEVIMAIHDCDEDLNRAVNALLEGVSSEWEVKKKKARQSTISKSSGEQPRMVNKNIDWDGIPRLQNDRLTCGRGRVSHISRRCKYRFQVFDISFNYMNIFMVTTIKTNNVSTFIISFFI